MPQLRINLSHHRLFFQWPPHLCIGLLLKLLLPLLLLDDQTLFLPKSSFSANKEQDNHQNYKDRESNGQGYGIVLQSFRQDQRRKPIMMPKLALIMKTMKRAYLTTSKIVRGK